MKLRDYVKDKIAIIIVGVIFLIVMEIFLVAFQTTVPLCVFCGSIFLLFLLVSLLWDFTRKKRFYDELLSDLEQLDKKYLVLEMLDKPEFLEGELLCQVLYDVDKSMAENVKLYEQGSHTFKEYIEMWIHEAKIPIASLRLMTHNEEIPLPEKYTKQIRRLDNLIDQVLYYVRAEHAEKDYLIREVSLKEIVKNAALHSKDDLLEAEVALKVEDVDYIVTTDGKWMEFILNQIINNSVKYRDEGKDRELRIWATEDAKSVSLHIRDNGIGIVANDIPRIFEKSFTGENGRNTAKSTGMGLYIVKNLCDRLGHGINADSVKGEYTEIVIQFGKNEFYEVG